MYKRWLETYQNQAGQFNKNIHIIIITNGLFIGIIALVNSILQNCNRNEKKNLNFHFLVDIDETIELDNLINIVQAFEGDEFNYDIKEFSNNDYKKLIQDNIIMENDNIIKYLDFAKFFISSIYSNLDKIIYLNSNMICQGDISELRDEYFNLLDDDNQLLSSENINNGDIKDSTFNSYNISSENLKYFNAGIFITSLDNWRQNNIQDTLLYWMKENKKHSLFKFGAQPILNIAFINKVKYIDDKWNTVRIGNNSNLSIDEIESAKILHWNGDAKWWNMDGLYKNYGEIYNLIKSALTYPTTTTTTTT